MWVHSERAVVQMGVRGGWGGGQARDWGNWGCRNLPTHPTNPETHLHRRRREEEEEDHGSGSVQRCGRASRS
jgi:hypothetical protein